MYSVAELCDTFADQIRVLEPLFTDFGGRLAFGGPVSTVRCFEDNSVVRLTLEEPGQGRILVVDGGGSERCALLGDELAGMAMENGWAGIVLYGCIRDSEAISQMDVAIKALNTHPRASRKNNEGDRDSPVHFAGVTFMPGEWLYADLDGLVISPDQLAL